MSIYTCLEMCFTNLGSNNLWHGRLVQTCRVNKNIGTKSVHAGSTNLWPGKLVQACRCNDLLNQNGSGWFNNSLTRQACTSLPEQRLVERNWFRLVQNIFDPANLYKLAGATIGWTKLVQFGSKHLWPGKLVQTCRVKSLPGHTCYEYICKYEEIAICLYV